MVSVTANSHPALFRAFELILRDAGGINRLEPAPEVYLVPLEFECSRANALLAQMTPEEFEAFCIGEQTEVEEKLKVRPELMGVYELLNAFADDWELC